MEVVRVRRSWTHQILVPHKTLWMLNSVFSNSVGTFAKVDHISSSHVAWTTRDAKTRRGKFQCTGDDSSLSQWMFEGCMQ